MNMAHTQHRTRRTTGARLRSADASSNNVCRVVVVDDEGDELEKQVHLAAQLSGSPLLDGVTLKVDASNSAYFVAAELAAHPERPAWDLVIADVFMPRPFDPANKSVTLHTANRRLLRVGAADHALYLFRYADRAVSVEHGGVHIVRSVAQTRGSAPDRGLKVVLISAFFDDGRDRVIQDLQRDHRTWLRCYDKPGSGFDPRTFKLALVTAIRERRSGLFGDAAFSRPRLPRFVCDSPVMAAIDLKIRDLARRSNVDCLWLSGPRGTGKATLARLMHDVRKEALGGTGGFVTFDPHETGELFRSALFGRREYVFKKGTTLVPGAMHRASGGTVYIPHVDRLGIVEQRQLAGMLLRRRFVPVDGSEEESLPLVIVSTSERVADLERDARPHDPTFEPDLLARLRACEAIEVPPLFDRPADIEPLARLALPKGVELDPRGSAVRILRTARLVGVVQLIETVERAAREAQSAALDVVDGRMIRAALDGLRGITPVAASQITPAVGRLRRKAGSRLTDEQCMAVRTVSDRYLALLRALSKEEFLQSPAEMLVSMLQSVETQEAWPTQLPHRTFIPAEVESSRRIEKTAKRLAPALAVWRVLGRWVGYDQAKTIRGSAREVPGTH